MPTLGIYILQTLSTYVVPTHTWDVHNSSTHSSKAFAPMALEKLGELLIEIPSLVLMDFFYPLDVDCIYHTFVFLFPSSKGVHL
jgi:hypothetical protein